MAVRKNHCVNARNSLIQCEGLVGETQFAHLAVQDQYETSFPRDRQSEIPSSKRATLPYWLTLGSTQDTIACVSSMWTYPDRLDIL